MGNALTIESVGATKVLSVDVTTKRAGFI